MNKVKVENPKLISNLVKLQNNYSEENQFHFYKELKKAKLLLPAIIKEQNKINVIKITDNKEKDYLPAFTDWESMELNENNYNTQSVVFTIDEYIKLMESDLKVEGIIINPYSHNLVLSRENLRYLIEGKTKIHSDEQISIGIPLNYPQKLINNLVITFKKEQNIKNVYLLQMVRSNHQKSLLLVVDVERNEEEIFKKLAKCSTKYISENEIIDIISFNSDFGRNITKEYHPIYSNEADA